MEDGFKARVDKLFGSHLFKTVPKSSFPESSWSVVEGEVEKKEWNRDKGETHPGREDTPLSSTYEACFGKNLGRYRNSEERRFEEDLGAFEDEEEEQADVDGGGDREREEFDREEKDIRSSIGLDSTLDFEEEEDEYDREAVGMGDIGERLYMKDVKDHGPYLNYHSIEEISEELLFLRDPDPRADHAAASARIKEDTEGSAPIRSAPSIKSPLEEKPDIKPILKRKIEQAEARPKKQVRFDRPASETDQDSQIRANDPRIPDYLRNPSKYVCYSLESEGNLDENSNRQAFSEFWEIVRQRKGDDLESGQAPPPGSVIFTPRKRLSDPKAIVSPPTSQVSTTVIAAAIAMDEDEMQEDVGLGGSLRTARHYRSRPISEN